ncbi:MAG TPA: hypothetical protein VIL01_13920 [Thermomicrobiales bacterium]
MVIVTPIIVVLAIGIYLASLAGELPWQEDPTRVATGITPFADIPGFSMPTRVSNANPTATP